MTVQTEPGRPHYHGISVSHYLQQCGLGVLCNNIYDKVTYTAGEHLVFLEEDIAEERICVIVLIINKTRLGHL